jgi:hypothetical protein
MRASSCVVLLAFSSACAAQPPAVEPAVPAATGSPTSSPSAPGSAAPTSEVRAPAEVPVEAPLVGFRAQAVGPHYKVHAALVGPCRAGAECRVKVTLEAVDGYRVSAPYPERLEVKDVTNAEPLGTDPAGKGTFSKAAGDFTVDASHPEVGVMTVRFRPASRGAVTLSALFYVAVETDKDTTIARPMLSWSVTAE